jgi:hypothetical protein
MVPKLQIEELTGSVHEYLACCVFHSTSLNPGCHELIEINSRENEGERKP